MDNFQEAECAVIGGLLIDNSKVLEIELLPAHFGDGSLGVIYESIQSLDRLGKPFDVFTVSSELARTTGKDWTATVAQIARNTASARNVVEYASQVKRFHRNRSVRRICTELLETVSAESGAVDKAIGCLMSLDETNRNTSYSMREVVTQAADEIERSLKSDGGLPGISTGFIDFDESFGGYQKGDLFILGARPAMGKTGFLLSSLLNCKVPAGVISAEMSATQIGLRAISSSGRIDSQNLRTANLTEQEWALMGKAVAYLSELRIVINDKSSPTIGEVQAWVRKMKHKAGIEILFVDYLQRLQGNNPKLSRVEQVGEIAIGLKTIARELGIPVVAMAQVNREVEKRDNKRPQMGDLANSSEIEKEADVIVMLYREEVYNPSTERSGVAELRVEKNRHGPTGLIELNWISEYILFEDLVHKWP